MTFEIKRGDLEPPLVVDVSGSSGDLSTVSSWKVIAKRGATLAFTDVDPVVTLEDPPTAAAVRHNWVAGETDTAGDLSVEVEATWPGGRKQTFPPDGYVTVTVVPDLG